jgi:hypothetical protein
MWNLKKPDRVKLIIGILAADNQCLSAAANTCQKKFGQADFLSHIWHFRHTDYYRNETGDNILRQFISIDHLIRPGKLAAIKHRTNRLERKLAENLDNDLPRPVNLDPGIIEPSKLVLATTKNHSHRVYIGKKMYAEVTLVYKNGTWQHFDYTYPDYRQERYFEFFEKVRKKLLEQRKSHH